ncbi:hypothetical protein [Phenylobacterium sp.]|uniref:hypothetical protein n=1 Tax=Phenylobacterium sp. TaxID=1871053 RepID=UPI0027301EB1|nr:hypothetical protein [Phenylobacterium sp.]MDP2214104.1 hypothetical protein [Phenylobacterium sp.]
MRPKTPLAERISKATGVSTKIIQETICSPTTGDHSCWGWGRSYKGTMPVIMFEGRPQPVRRVLVIAAYGDLPATTRVMPACPNKRCVNPVHTRVKHQFIDGHVSLTPPADPEAGNDDIMDVIDAVYSRDQPWDAAALAEEFGYSLALVEEAIRKIVEEGL